MIDNDNDDVVITIIALVIGLTLVAICLVCFHIKKVREGNNNSSNPREDSGKTRFKFFIRYLNFYFLCCK